MIECRLLVSSLPRKWPLVLPFAVAIVLEVCTLSVHSGNICWPKQGHACIADQNWYCPGCVAGAGRSENIRVKSKDVGCWVVLSVAVLRSGVSMWRMLRCALGWAILQAVVPPNVGCIGVRAVAYALGCGCALSAVGSATRCAVAV